MIGELVDGKYRVVRQIGQGGMGAVYEAKDESQNDKRVALKVIVNHGATQNKEIVARFQREARAAGAIDTQHIVQVLDTGTDPATSHPYMVMEYLAGEDLSGLVARVGPVAPDIALKIATQAATGLERAHARGVVHRDVKPANLYLAQTDDGVLVKVLDFGIAKVAIDLVTTAENAALTRTGSMLGSPLYMSPEQAKGLRSVGAQTDIWSLGVVLYESLSGQPPNAKVESLGQLILAICGEPAKPIQTVAPWVPAGMASIVDRALQIDVAKRFATMQEMLDAMRALLPGGVALRIEDLAAVSPEMRNAPALADTARVLGNATTLGIGAHAIPSIPSIPSRSPMASLPVVPEKRTTWSFNTFAAIVIGLILLGFIGKRLLHPRALPVRTLASATAREKDAPPSRPEPSTANVTVSLAIVPPTAEVELDGKKVTVNDGKITMEGAPDSVHEVRLTSGKRHAEHSVRITERGIPAPPVVGLGGGGGGGGGGAPPVTTVKRPAP